MIDSSGWTSVDRSRLHAMCLQEAFARAGRAALPLPWHLLRVQGRPAHLSAAHGHPPPHPRARVRAFSSVCICRRGRIVRVSPGTDRKAQLPVGGKALQGRGSYA